ncbi:MAG: hypothetical protein ILM98_02460, partial [Kiritimatiellae bacterium]|nr:hypothetical protein [Kiritimatiellia bacterium]
FSAFGVELNLPLSLDCSKPDAVLKLEQEIRERKYNDELSIHLWEGDVIPELPKHEFRTIRVWGNNNEEFIIDLSPLAGHTPEHLVLFYGTFSNLAALQTAKIKTLSASIGTDLHADDLSRGDWSSLQNLLLDSIRGDILDLRSAAKLESLMLCSDNAALAVRLSPQLRLKELTVSGAQLPLLRAIQTGALKDLSIISGTGTDEYAPLAEVNLPELTVLGCYARSRDLCRLSFMPKLKKLALQDFPLASLKHIRTQCPGLEQLKMTRIPEVTDWEELSNMSLKRLHVAGCGGARWSLPVSPPPGCEVTGLPLFIENPYKMWSAWAAATILFGLWTFFWQRRRPKGNGDAK